MAPPRRPVFATSRLTTDRTSKFLSGIRLIASLLSGWRIDRFDTFELPHKADQVLNRMPYVAAPFTYLRWARQDSFKTFKKNGTCKRYTEKPDWNETTKQEKCPLTVSQKSRQHGRK
jgi:hypothetical protein